MGGGVVPSAETQQFLDRIPDPGAPGIAAYNTLINALVAAGYWAVCDGLLVRAWDGLKSTFLINLKNATYNGVVTGLDAYDSAFGWRGDGGRGTGGSAAYMSVGFTPSTAGGNYTQNSAHLWEWNYNGSTNLDAPSTEPCIGTETGAVLSHIFPVYSDNLSYFRVNDAIGSPMAGIANLPIAGFKLANRSSSTARQAYQDGASAGTATVTSAALSNRPLYLGATNSNGTANKSRRFHWGYGWGGSVDATMAAAVYAALAAYYDALDEHLLGGVVTWRMSSFNNSNENLYWSAGKYGEYFTDQGISYAKTPDVAVRDPKPYRASNGDIYVAYTNNTFGAQMGSCSIAKSTDNGATWTRHGIVDLSGLTGGLSTGHIYAPNWQEEAGNLYLIFSWNNNSGVSDFQLGYIQSTDLAANTWGTATAITGTQFPANCIDGVFIKVGSTYRMFCKDEATFRIVVLTSSSPWSGYDTRDTTMASAINTASGNIATEGNVLIQFSANWWRLHLDAYTTGALNVYYLDTYDQGVTWEPRVMIKQSALSPIRHSGFLRYVA